MARSFRTSGCLLAAAVLASPLCAADRPRGGFFQAVKTGILCYLLAGPTLAAEVTGPELPGPGPEVPAPLTQGELRAALRTYPASLCPDTQDDWFFDRKNHCSPRDPAIPATSAELEALCENLGDPAAVEEYLKSAEHQVKDLEDCVCRALHMYRRSDSQGREQALLGRLKNARQQRRELFNSIKEAERIRQKAWNKLGRNPRLWEEPGDVDTMPRWPDGVPYPMRADLMTGLVFDLQQAGARFDRDIDPLIERLKERADPKRKRKAGPQELALPSAWSGRG
jgi:hypothetical protein